MDETFADRIASRLIHLTQAVGEVRLSTNLPADYHLIDRPWVAITSSRLGQNPILHREVCQLVSLCMIECRRRNMVLLVAVGSAIEPWTLRAAELFAVPTVRLLIGNVDAKEPQPSIGIQPIDDRTLSRDAALISVADRVDAVYVRQGGTIDHCLGQRIEQRADVSTRVAVTSLPKCAGRRLIQDGAVGWFALGEQASETVKSKKKLVLDDLTDSWMHTDDQWLVHCTRGCVGPWPGETERQYRDAMLLGNDVSPRGPLETLSRIIRSGRLIANAIASAKAWPVVCFSAASLAELLLSRCYRPHLKRWDYEPYGIAIRRSVAGQLGLQSVVYGSPDQRSEMAEADQFRFQAAGKTYDWTAEREWRSPRDIDLTKLDLGDVRVFVATEADAAAIESTCPWDISAVTHACASLP